MRRRSVLMRFMDFEITIIYCLKRNDAFVLLICNEVNSLLHCCLFSISKLEILNPDLLYSYTIFKILHSLNKYRATPSPLELSIKLFDWNLFMETRIRSVLRILLKHFWRNNYADYLHKCLSSIAHFITLKCFEFQTNGIALRPVKFI